jgi:hypothetical protein
MAAPGKEKATGYPEDSATIIVKTRIARKSSSMKGFF